MKDLKQILKTIIEVFKEDPIGALVDLLSAILLLGIMYFLLWLVA
jgi:hypothetical protein